MMWERGKEDDERVRGKERQIMIKRRKGMQ